MPDPPDAPIASHSNPVTQAGFTMIPNVVMLRSDLSPIAKLLYGYLKHLAWRNGSDATSSPLETISDDLVISVSSLGRHITELCRAPAAEGGDKDGPALVVSTRRGRGLPNVYVVNDPAKLTIVDDFSRPHEDPLGSWGGVVKSTNQESSNRQLLARAGSSSDIKTKTQDKTPPIDPPAGQPKKVDGIPVTEDEYDLAARVLEAFNRRALTRFTPSAWTPKIIMRIREHPELALADHALVIARAFDDPWWKGVSTPSVVYGNGPVFERAMAAVETPTSGRGLTPEEIATYTTIWGPGTGYATLAEARAAGSHPIIEAT